MGRILLVAIALFLTLPAPAVGQARATGADVDGTVVDQSGGILADAAIAVTSVETSIVRTTVTDGSGRYRVPALPPGTYNLSAALPGFTTRTLEKVVLVLGEAVTIDFTLRVAGITETATVAGEVLPVQVSRTEMSSVVNQEQVDALPTDGRNFISFAVITPAVAPDHTPQQGATTTSGLSFAGQRSRSNNIMVDGLDNNDLVVGAVRATFSQEAIREFQVLANSYSAEFGKASGGVVNIVTRSGTNVFHGNAFFYFRNETLNAKKYFEQFDVFGNPVDLAKAPFDQKQSGATFGGPLRKGKTFFFGSYERTGIVDSRLVTIDPAAAAVLNSLGFPVELGNVGLRTSNNEVLGKIDHHWSPTSTLVMRGNYADIDRDGIDEFGGSVARSRGTVQHRTDWSISAAESDVLSSRWINELRAQFARENQHIDALDPLCGGACTGVDQGGPTLELTGVASIGRQRLTPQLRLNERLQVLDTVSYFRGRHRFKFGGEYNHIGFPSHGNELPLHFGGRYIFSTIAALGVTSALDGLRKGIPAAYIQGYGNWIYPYTWYADLSLFAQDEWRLGRFIVKAGLRYQRQFWDQFTSNVSDVGGGTFSYPLPSDNNNFAPRLAVGHDLTGDGRTSLHGSYGLFYDNIITAVPTVGRLITGAPDGVRTLVLAAPRAAIAWSAPGHRLTEEQAGALLGGSYPSTVITLDPSLKTSYTHQVSGGLDRALAADLALGVNVVYVRGYNMPGTVDYNPVLSARLGAGRRPNDRSCPVNQAAPCVNGGIPGTSASILQYTAFGESWYRGLTLSLNKRPSHNHEFRLSYTLSKAEDTSTDFQSNFIVQNNGYGRNPDDRFGLPLGFDPESERGAATQDQRHRFVLSGVYHLPQDIQVAGIFAAASGRPYTPLAGVDLNGDGNGGSFPPDRARVNLADEATSVARNSETTAAQYTLDLRVSKKFRLGKRGTVEAILDAFNVFNRVNFVEDSNQSSFAVFGSGSYPANPLPTYGRYTLTLPPRQLQVAGKITF